VGRKEKKLKVHISVTKDSWIINNEKDDFHVQFSNKKNFSVRETRILLQFFLRLIEIHHVTFMIA